MKFVTYLVSSALSFNTRPIRVVDVPDEEVPEGIDTPANELLEKIFKYGQNDFQPLENRSLSVGDVVKLSKNVYFEVKDIGWNQIKTMDLYNKIQYKRRLDLYKKQLSPYHYKQEVI